MNIEVEPLYIVRGYRGRRLSGETFYVFSGKAEYKAEA